MDVDTSSYLKPAQLPAAKSVLDQVKDYGAIQQQQQQIESGGLTINKQKLDLANQGLQYMTRAMGSLGPDATKEQYLAVGKNAVRMGLVPGDMLHIYEDRLKAAPTSKDFYNEFMTTAAGHQEQIDYHLGTPGTIDTGAAVQPVQTSPKPGFGIRSTGLPIAKQPGPGQIEYDNRRNLPDGSVNPNFGQPIYRGVQPSQGAPGMVTAPPPAPGARLPVASSPSAITPPAQTPNQVVQNRTPAAAGLPPGAAEAATGAGAASGLVLAKERDRASSFQRDIFPLAQAIPALEKLGTKGTGPGTQTFNDLKSFVLSNVPGVKESDFGFGSVKDFDKVHKYLTDFVNQTGNSGTNDKLAAAFAGNPSVKISNAAAADVAKAALALRRMQQSKYLGFEDSGLQPDQASKYFANGEIKYKSGDGQTKSIKVSQLDPRAFGVDVMSPKAKKQLLEQLNKNPREKELFDRSAEIAIQHGYLTP